jgi:hypothetical protein
MIGFAELNGDYPGRDKQVYSLVYRAAKLGNVDALNDMSSVYQIVLDDQNADVNPVVDKCFQELANRAPAEDVDYSEPVDRCLRLAGIDSSK